MSCAMCGNKRRPDGLTDDSGKWLCGLACITKWYAEPAQVGVLGDAPECPDCELAEERIETLNEELGSAEFKIDRLEEELRKGKVPS